MQTIVTTEAPRGLSAAEVRARTTAGDTNTAGGVATRSYGQIIRESVFTFINNTLFALGIALLLLGRPMDALLSAGVVFINVVVSSFQEIQAKRPLDRIALLNRPQAVVIRDGQEQTITPEAVVRGDLLKVSAGDQLIVDGSVVGDGRAELDESQVTGEADRIARAAGDPVFSGSYVVAGSLYYVAEKVGAASLANQITAGALRAAEADGLNIGCSAKEARCRSLPLQHSSRSVRPVAWTGRSAARSGPRGSGLGQRPDGALPRANVWPPPHTAVDSSRRVPRTTRSARESVPGRRCC
ncbi:MAG: hypothetical protein HXY37_01250 [Chloroflexi bacterium]|nr:hypothetical protein [Chloroflexota bacterium]